MNKTLAALLMGFLASGCIPLVVGPNNFTPAGEIHKGSSALGLSAEMGPTLSTGLGAGDAQKTISWLAEDLFLRYGVGERVELEGQLKWASSIPFIIPIPIGGGVGVRGSVLRQELDGVSMDCALRLTGVKATNKGSVTVLSSTTTWNDTAWAVGAELQAPFSYRATRWLAVTAAPLARVYSLGVDSSGSGGTKSERGTFAAAGLSLSLELKAWAFVFTPALAAQWVRMPDGKVSFAPLSPGLATGWRW